MVYSVSQDAYTNMYRAGETIWSTILKNQHKYIIIRKGYRPEHDIVL